MKESARSVVMVVAALAFAACSSPASSSSSTEPPSLYNNWLYTDSAGTGGLGLTLTKDNKYVSTVLQLTSSTSGNAQIETGTIAVTSSSITFTPQKWSCEEPTDPAYTGQYRFNGNSLELAFSNGVTGLQINSAPAATNFSLAIGCFLKDGSFVPSPLTPVGTCSGAGGTCSGSAVCCMGYTCGTGGTCQ